MNELLRKRMQQASEVVRHAGLLFSDYRTDCQVSVSQEQLEKTLRALTFKETQPCVNDNHHLSAVWQHWKQTSAAPSHYQMRPFVWTTRMPTSEGNASLIVYHANIDSAARTRSHCEVLNTYLEGRLRAESFETGDDFLSQLRKTSLNIPGVREYLQRTVSSRNNEELGEALNPIGGLFRYFFVGEQAHRRLLTIKAAKDQAQFL